MDMRLELVPIPVSDVERAKGFYVDKVGFGVDHDVAPAEGVRVVQLTPNGSACSIVLGQGPVDAENTGQEIDDIVPAEMGVPPTVVVRCGAYQRPGRCGRDCARSALTSSGGHVLKLCAPTPLDADLRAGRAIAHKAQLTKCRWALDRDRDLR